MFLEFVDTHTPVPMGAPAICKRTGRTLIEDKARKTDRATAEISVQIIKDARTLRTLKSPPVRVCAPDEPIGYGAIMEQYFLRDKTMSSPVSTGRCNNGGFLLTVRTPIRPLSRQRCRVTERQGMSIRVSRHTARE